MCIYRLFIVFLLAYLVTFTPALGSDWVQTNGPYGGRVICLAVGNSYIFAGTEINGIFRSSDNGATWERVNNGITNSQISDIAVCGPNVFAATYNALFRSLDNGESWVKAGIHFDTTFISFAVNGSTIFVTAKENVYRSTDYGISWEVSFRCSNNFVHTVAFGLGGIFLCYDNKLYRSSDNGDTWDVVDSEFYANRFSVAQKDSLLFAISSGSGFLSSADSGKTWVILDQNRNISISDDIELVSIGDDLFTLAHNIDTDIYRISDNGKTWTSIANGLPLDSYGINTIAVNGTDLLVGTQRGILRSFDRGDSWQESNEGLTNALIRHLFAHNGILYANAEYVGLFRSTDHGSSWKKIPDVGTVPFAAKDSFIFSGGFRSSDNGESWTQLAGLSNARLLAVSDTYLFAWTGKQLLRSSDYGNSWEIKATDKGLQQTDFTKLTVCGNTLFAGTNSSYLWRLSDSAQQWIQLKNGEPNNASALIERGNELFLGSGSVWRSSDLGESWRLIDSGMTTREVLAGGYVYVKVAGVKSLAQSNYGLLAGTEKGIYLLPNGSDRWIAGDLDKVNADLFSLAVIDDTVFGGTIGGVFKRSISDISGVKKGIENRQQHSSLIIRSMENRGRVVTVNVSQASSGRVVLAIYALSGQKIAILEDKYCLAGSHIVIWNAGNMSKGCYIASLQKGSFLYTKSFTVFR